MLPLYSHWKHSVCIGYKMVTLTRNRLIQFQAPCNIFGWKFSFGTVFRYTINQKRHSIFRLSFNIPAGIHLLKVYNRSTRTRCEICSKLTGVFTVNFEHISHLVLVLLLLTLNRQLPAGIYFQQTSNYFIKIRHCQYESHVRVRTRGLEMLVFRKILHTYLMDGPSWRLCQQPYCKNKIENSF